MKGSGSVPRMRELAGRGILRALFGNAKQRELVVRITSRDTPALFH
jgi:hypothetical protein